MFLLIWSPKPMPSYLSSASSLTLPNILKSIGIFVSLIPLPLSCTWTISLLSRDSNAIYIFMEPLGAYLSAFLVKLTKTCYKRTLSPSRISGRSCYGIKLGSCWWLKALSRVRIETVLKSRLVPCARHSVSKIVQIDSRVATGENWIDLAS